MYYSNKMLQCVHFLVYAWNKSYIVYYSFSCVCIIIKGIRLNYIAYINTYKGTRIFNSNNILNY